MDDGTAWQCLISEPEGCIRLPVGEAADLSRWSKGAAQSYLGVSTPKGEAGRLSSVLERLAETSELSDPTFAYAYVVDAAKAVTAVYEVHDYDADGYRSVDRLADLLRDVLPTFPDRRNVVQVNLPVGPGVRVQEISSVEKGSFLKKKVLMETVTYAALPPQADNVLVLRMSWTNLVFSEALQDLAQTLADSLELVEVKEDEG
ncbi:hypothetical protein [Streptomyces sp. NPDC054794]